MNSRSDVPQIDSATVEALLVWWRDAQRDLPWRDTRDPWAILVSEVMSQQTQLERVIPKWFEFLHRYPTPASLARASVGDVIGFWVGLGYNRRARMLHECATVIESTHGGVVPDELDLLLALPGVGPYTARAVLAFAFEHDVAVVDTNVGRILARLSATTFNARSVQDLADRIVPSGSGWRWNQAILDFGASICTKRNPSCSGCPVVGHCQWAGQGPDPAQSSAGVSGRQSSFVGSDREGRGRLIRALREGPVDHQDLAMTMGWPGDSKRVDRVLGGLIRDGMVVSVHQGVRLP